MRMKNDYMQNGQLKAGYNVQGSSNNQFIVNYTLDQTPNDTTTLKSHLQEHIDSFNQVLDTLTADASYGSEENYQELENQDIEAFVKYNYFHKEQKETKSKIDKKPFTVNKLYYNEQTDTYYCRMGQAMKNIGTYQKKTATCKLLINSKPKTVMDAQLELYAIKQKVIE